MPGHSLCPRLFLSQHLLGEVDGGAGYLGREPSIHLDFEESQLAEVLSEGEGHVVTVGELGVPL